jgi:hypothetical protein
MQSKSFENNPFFVVDVLRWGQRDALREWLSASSVHGREQFVKPFSVCVCGGVYWASPSRPVVCFVCRNVAA